MPDPPPTELVRITPQRPQLVFDRFILEVREGPDRGNRQTFAQPEVQIGTARANDFVVTDRTVSRFHARIDNQEGRLLLVDLESTNGSFVGPHRVGSLYLTSATSFRLGGTEIRFEPLGETTTVDLPAIDHMGPLIGSSSRMRQVYATIERVADSQLSVVVIGETGTGKDLVAHVLHENSARAGEPFEILDCAAIPENLIESELFGHVKGAFTGADRDRAGIFERTHGGTVFLDEIGELPLHLQPKLLRVLETGGLRRVGGNKSIEVDVRVVAATHRPLRRLVNDNSFREDLYYRIAGCTIEMPPLRERTEDIPALVTHFLEQMRQPTCVLDEETRARFLTYPWPGNIRQLRNAVERLAVLGSADLSQASTPAIGSDDNLATRSYQEVCDDRDRCYVEALLAAHGGDITQAARVAQVHPKTIRRMMHRLAIDQRGSPR